jgi:Carboxypeptidase regulatory-like domain
MSLRKIRHSFKMGIALATTTLLLCAIVVHAQDTTTMSGTVTDQAGKVLSGATVTITNIATNASRNTKTGDDGVFVFNQVFPATYNVRIEAKGFKSYVQENVELLVRTPMTLNAQLEVGAVSETVTVSGGEVQLNTHDATMGNTITAQQISRLPLEGQNIVSLLALQPGVTFIGNVGQDGNTTDYRNGSVNGGKADQANVTLDGVDVNDQQGGQAFLSVLRVTAASLQEFRTVTSNPNADQGRSSGAQVSMVTKGGTNNWHGSAYEFHRNTIFTANDWFNNLNGTQRPKLIRNVFGASFGGPIIKDRLFFFLNYEGRRDAREESVLRVVPGADLRKGTFTFLQFTDATKTATKISTLDAAAVTALDPAHIGPDPAVLARFQLYPLPNDKTVGDGLNTFGFRFNSPIKLRWNTYISRLDYNLTKDGKHTLFGRGNLQNDKDNSSQQFPGQTPRFTNLTTNKGFAGGYSASLSQNLVNVLHLGYTRVGVENAGSSALASSHIVTFRNFDDLVPAVRSLTRFTPVWNVVDDVAWVKSSHSMQFGTNIRWIRNQRINFATSFSNAVINKAWLLSNGPIRPPLIADTSTDHAMAALLGLVTQITSRFNLDIQGGKPVTLPEGSAIKRRYAADEYEWYAQDSWRVKPSLTLTYGLRYGLYSPPWETNGLQVSPTFPLGLWFDTRGGLMQRGIPDNQSAPLVQFNLAGPVNGKKSFYDWDKNNFAPRFAFAYSPKSNRPVLKWLTGGEANKMAIRGGYSLVYDRIGGALAVNADSGTLSFGLSTSVTNPAGVLTPLTTPRFTNVTDIPTTSRDGQTLFLPAPGFGTFPATFPSGLAAGGFAITSAIDDAIRTPYSQTITFSISRELPGNMVFEAAYVGRLGRHILVNDDLAMPLNLVDPASGMDYFTAGQLLARLDLAGTPVASVPKVAFWENLFPGYATSTLTATQVIYQKFYSATTGAGPDYTTSLFGIDVSCNPCSKLGKFALFNSQFSNLNALRSIMPTNYHSLQLLLRRRFTGGFTMDFSYTYGKSQDLASTLERNGLFSGSIWNAWSPTQRKGISDFDMTHQANMNGLWEMPIGKGRHFLKDSPGWLDAVVGGWQLTGIMRVTSGLPTSIGNGFAFPTNWEFTGNATQLKAIPQTGVTKNVKVIPTDSGGPNIFADPLAAFSSFTHTLPGGVGTRNSIRGDGFFTVDMGLSKAWRMPYREGHRLSLRWEVFNVTNSVSFDPQALKGANLDSRNTFGKYSGTLSSPRVMQVGLRYDF